MKIHEDNINTLKKNLMKKLFFLLSIISMTYLNSCSGNEKADLVIINGKVLTLNKDKPYAEAVAIKGETILAVGPAKEISKR